MKKCCFFFIYKCFAFVNFWGLKLKIFFHNFYTLYYQEVKVYDDIDLNHGEAKKEQKLVFFNKIAFIKNY